MSDRRLPQDETNVGYGWNFKYSGAPFNIIKDNYTINVVPLSEDKATAFITAGRDPRTGKYIDIGTAKIPLTVWGTYQTDGKNLYYHDKADITKWHRLVPFDQMDTYILNELLRKYATMSKEDIEKNNPSVEPPKPIVPIVPIVPNGGSDKYSDNNINVSETYQTKLIRKETIWDMFGTLIIWALLGVVGGSFAYKMYQDKHKDTDIEEYYEMVKRENKLKQKQGEAHAEKIKAEGEKTKGEQMAKSADEKIKKHDQDIKDGGDLANILEKEKKNTLKAKKPETSKELLKKIETRQSIDKALDGEKNKFVIGSLSLAPETIQQTGGILKEGVSQVGKTAQVGIES